MLRLPSVHEEWLCSGRVIGHGEDVVGGVAGHGVHNGERASLHVDGHGLERVGVLVPHHHVPPSHVKVEVARALACVVV